MRSYAAASSGGVGARLGTCLGTGGSGKAVTGFLQPGSTPLGAHVLTLRGHNFLVSCGVVEKAPGTVPRLACPYSVPRRIQCHAAQPGWSLPCKGNGRSARLAREMVSLPLAPWSAHVNVCELSSGETGLGFSSPHMRTIKSCLLQPVPCHQPCHSLSPQVLVEGHGPSFTTGMLQNGVFRQSMHLQRYAVVENNAIRMVLHGNRSRCMPLGLAFALQLAIISYLTKCPSAFWRSAQGGSHHPSIECLVLLHGSCIVARCERWVSWLARTTTTAAIVRTLRAHMPLDDTLGKYTAHLTSPDGFRESLIYTLRKGATPRQYTRNQLRGPQHQ